MDELPAISALHDEESPPPNPSSYTSFRIKLPKRTNPMPEHYSSAQITGQSPNDESSEVVQSGKMKVEEEQEEDELIDDNDNGEVEEGVNEGTIAADTKESLANKLLPIKKPRNKKNKISKDKDPVFMVSTFEVTAGPQTQATTTEDSWAPIQTCAPSTDPKPSKRKLQVKKEKPVLGRPKKTRWVGVIELSR